MSNEPMSGIGAGLEGVDLSGESQSRTEEDHYEHVAGRVCARCGDPIEADQIARRKGVNGWVHDVCPLID